jgi:hypothetical protein
MENEYSMVFIGLQNTKSRYSNGNVSQFCQIDYCMIKHLYEPKFTFMQLFYVLIRTGPWPSNKLCACLPACLSVCIFLSGKIVVCFGCECGRLLLVG